MRENREGSTDEISMFTVFKFYLYMAIPWHHSDCFWIVFITRSTQYIADIFDLLEYRKRRSSEHVNRKLNCRNGDTQIYLDYNWICDKNYCGRVIGKMDCDIAYLDLIWSHHWWTIGINWFWGNVKRKKRYHEVLSLWGFLTLYLMYTYWTFFWLREILNI